MDNNLEELKNNLKFIRFKKVFLFEFTKQMIKNSVASDIVNLETRLEKGKKEKIEKTKEKIKEIIEFKESKEKEKLEEIGEKVSSTSAREIREGRIPRRRSIIHPPIGMFEVQKIPQVNPFEKSFQKIYAETKPQIFIDPLKKMGLFIPESRFPEHLEYIRPSPTAKNIELGKLNPLIEDPMVKIIECYGPGENLVVQGNMGTQKTGIILNIEEIEDILQKFSRETKIPLHEGVFKVVVGKLMFLAIISEIVGSKFIIKKILTEQPFYGV